MMDWDSGIALIRSLQGAGWLATPMHLITLLGTETFFLLLIPLVYWCVDTRLGTRVGLVLLLSTSLNSALKLAFAAPRPYWYSPEVAALEGETTFGLPSAHAQHAVAVWGTLAAGIGRGWAWALALLLAFVIGLSRIYLGVHFPADVLTGWALGGLVLAAFAACWGPVGRWVSRRTLTRQIALTLAASLLMLAPSILIAQTFGTWQLPPAWAQQALRAGPEYQPQPLALSTPISAAGTWFGFGLGALWLAATRQFSAAGTPWRRLLRYLIGLPVLFAIWAGLDALFPEGETLAAYGLRYLRYTLVGVWVGAGAPLLFGRLGLAELRPRPDDAFEGAAPVVPAAPTDHVV